MFSACLRDTRGKTNLDDVLEIRFVNDDSIECVRVNSRTIDTNFLFLRWVYKIHDDEEPVAITRSIVSGLSLFLSHDLRKALNVHNTRTI